MQQGKPLAPAQFCHICRAIPFNRCAFKECCNLVVCCQCFMKADESTFCQVCNPVNRIVDSSKFNLPVPRCLRQCAKHYESGWGERCNNDCKRAIGHQDYCDCLQDHTRRPGWDSCPTFDSPDSFHRAYPIGSRRYSKYCRDHGITHYVGDGDEWHEWQPGKGKGKHSSSSSQSSSAKDSHPTRP